MVPVKAYIKFRVMEEDEPAALNGMAPFRARFEDMTPEQITIIRENGLLYHHHDNGKLYSVSDLRGDGEFGPRQ